MKIFDTLFVTLMAVLKYTAITLIVTIWGLFILALGVSLFKSVFGV